MKTTACAVIAALLSFLIGNVWVFLSAEMFVQYFYEARMVALTHVFTLGWISLMIIGVLRQLGPVAFGLKSSNPALIGVAVALWIPALLAMVVGFASLRYTLAAAGTLLLFPAVLIIALAFIPVLREFAQPSDRSTAFLAASWICLIVVAVMGIWFALLSVPTAFSTQLQFVYGFLYLFGWLSLMILGMLYRIVPTHISKFLTARGITAAAGMRRAFVDPGLQSIVLMALLLGLAMSSAGILRENVVMFRLGWATWLTGILGFVTGLVRLGWELRNMLRSRPAA